MQNKLLACISTFTLLITSLFFSPSQALDYDEEFVDSEIIIKYRSKGNFSKKLQKLSLKSPSYSDAVKNQKLGSTIKKAFKVDVARSIGKKSKHPRYHSRSLKLLSNDSSQYSLVKLKKFKGQKFKLKRLVQAINQKHFEDDDLEILAAYPNYLFEINESPNDARYSEQDALQYINVEDAWQHSQGEDVVVAVIDTGVDRDHKDLAANIWKNQGEIPNNGKDDDNNGFIDDVEGYDFVRKGGFSCAWSEDCRKRDNKPDDVNGHGTHVAGIIAAVSDNRIGISGVAPKAKIMPLRAAYSVGFSALLTSADVAEAMQYAIKNGADIINMSFAGSRLGILKDLVEEAHELGIVMVAAAGNAGRSTETYPAALEHVISVGSVEASGYRSTYSNYGNWVDIVAPGTNILSLAPKNRFETRTGTSMSTPLVAGVAALIKSKNKATVLDPDEIKERLLSSAKRNANAQVLSSETSVASSVATLNADISYPLEVDSMDVPRSLIASTDIKITGSGSDSDSEISSYEWTSNLDGLLSESASFSSAELSPGEHILSLRVQNDKGEWSKKVSKEVYVAETRQLYTYDLADETKIVKKHGRLVARLPKEDRNRVEKYLWTSSKDGDLQDSRVIRLKDLSKGIHRISLLIRDHSGAYSTLMRKIIEVKS